MDNKTIYKKTLGFSMRRLLWDIIATIIFAATSITGFVIAQATTNFGLIGLGIGIIIGAIIISFILRYVSYSYKAGQVAMMTVAITEDKLPEDVIGAGKQIVKDRFSTVAVYYAATSVIKGIFQQIGQAITAVGRAIGGDNGGAVGSTISSIIQTVVAYLCDCCLGWVFYRKDQKPGKATCEGAVIFFKHGKTLAKNLGRVFGIGLLSLLVIGGIFGGIAYLIFQLFPTFFTDLSAKIAETATDKTPAFLTDPNTLSITFAAITGILLWAFIHSTFIRPYVLVGVLRNYINSGIDDIPTEESFKELDEKSPKFKKLHSEI